MRGVTTNPSFLEPFGHFKVYYGKNGQRGFQTNKGKNIAVNGCFSLFSLPKLPVAVATSIC